MMATTRPTQKRTEAHVPVHLYYGEDTYLATAAAKERIDAFLPREERVLSLEILAAESETIADSVLLIRKCREALDTISLFAPRRVVWLRDVVFLGESVASRSADVKEALEGLAGRLREGLPDTVTLIITAPSADGRLAFFKACKELGEVVEYGAPAKDYQKQQQAEETAVLAFRKAGLKASRDVLMDFAVRAGSDTRQIFNEVEKLALYLGERRTVTREDVAAVVCSARTVMAWDFPDAVARGQTVAAVRLLRQLLFQKETPIRLVVSLEQRFRQLMVYRAALDEGWLRAGHSYGKSTYEWRPLDEQAAARLAAAYGKDPSKENGFRVKVLADQAVLYTLPQLRERRVLVAEAHRRLVSSAVAADRILEILCFQLAAVGGAPYRGPS